jgi:hypothetical protein
LLEYAKKIYDLEGMILRVRDKRQEPRIKTPCVVKAALVMCLTRMGSLHAMGQTKSHPFWEKWIEGTFPSDRTIGRVFAGIYTEDLRAMLKQIYSCRKRNKSLKRVLGGKRMLVLDGHESSASYSRSCKGCLQRVIHTKTGDKTQYYHRVVAATLVCGNSCVLIDCEMQLPGEDEVAAAARLLVRVLKDYPRAFEIVGADGLYMRAGFFHLVLDAGKDMIAVLKNENRDLIQDARALFDQVEPVEFRERNATYRCWDIEGFKTWSQLRQPIRVVRSVETTRIRRQLDKKTEEETTEWMWATTIPSSTLPTREAVWVGHDRWAIENEGGFNELVNTWHANHVYKHDPNAILAFWLLAMITFDLFHAFLDLNIKLVLRVRYTAQYFLELVTGDFYGAVSRIIGRPP